MKTGSSEDTLPAGGCEGLLPGWECEGVAAGAALFCGSGTAGPSFCTRMTAIRIPAMTKTGRLPAVGILLGVPAPLADIAPPSVPLLIGELLPGAFPHGAAGGDRCDQDDGKNDEQAV